jgi:hypothetical protein
VEDGSTRLELYQEVVLRHDIADQSLCAGDVAMLVDYVEHPGQGEAGAVLEIFNSLGESIGVAIVPESSIEPLRANYVPAVRLLSSPT